MGEDISDHAGMAKFLEFLESTTCNISSRIIYGREVDIDFQTSSDVQRGRGASRIGFVSEDIGDLARDSEAKEPSRRNMSDFV